MNHHTFNNWINRDRWTLYFRYRVKVLLATTLYNQLTIPIPASLI